MDTNGRSQRPLNARLGDLLRVLRLKGAPGASAQIRYGRQYDLRLSHKEPRRKFDQTCNICSWTGPTFIGPFHCEMAECPQCGSVARDRFLMLSFLSRTPMSSTLRVLETSPRLGASYRRMMRRHFDYVASDYDLSAHEGDIRIDLQNIELPNESVDILLTPHVLEHVPDTKRALTEIHRVLSTDGRMYLQVPLFHGQTSVPAEPEFHADNTPVFFNFGWDLTDQIREAGFIVRVLVSQHFFEILTDRNALPSSDDPQFDVKSMWDSIVPSDLEILCDDSTSERFGFRPPFQFVTWECIKMTRH